MAKFLLVCARQGVPVPDRRVRRACAMLAPDHLAARRPAIRSRPGLTLAVASPTGLLEARETSLCLGQLLGPREGWWSPGSPVPDGAFALVRSDDATVELATDTVASRSVFYAATDQLFVASTSQRAIASVLGGFRLHREAVSWMLSAGSLGPGNGWDERVSRLGPDATVRLDRASWTLRRGQRPAVFDPRAARAREHAARLRDAALSACDGLDLGSSEWRLPLSGGHDSRFLLLALSRRRRIPCVTWGRASALEEPGNDALVARRLAAALGAPHEYFPMDASTEPLEALFRRFLVNGEGCVDHVGAYMDGFEVWRRLHDGGVSGIVRGDEGCGWEPVLTEPAVRWVLDAIMLGDFWSPERVQALGLAEQRWPQELQRARGESLATWRDRLYHSFRIPVILASLTDLKASYVEVANPLLSRRVLEVVRELPDHLRSDKLLFRQVVESMSPPIPFATRSAIPSLRLLVESGAFRALARAEVLAGAEGGWLPAPFAEQLLARLPAGPAAAPAAGRRSSARELLLDLVRKAVPRAGRSAIRSRRPRPPSDGALAFRAAIVSRMARTLAQDGADAPAPRATQAVS